MSVAAAAQPPIAATESAPPVVGVSRSRRFVPELESLRGWAILLVVAFHVDGYARFSDSTVPANSIPAAFVRAGHTGVDLFFVLSAFLLAQPFLTDAAGGRRVSLRDYWVRRALRILPIYWVAVIVATICTSTQPADLARGLPYLAFLNSFPDRAVPMNPWGSTWWSLATEVQFYVVLPALLLLRWWAGCVVLAAALGWWVSAYVRMVNGTFHMTSINGQLALTVSVFGRAPLFLCGIAAAVVYRRWGDAVRTRLARIGWIRNGGADAVFVALVIALGAFLQQWVAIGPAVQQSAPGQPYHVANGAIWTAILLVVLLAPLRTKWLVSNALFARLGILSYSIYLIHAPMVFLPLRAIRLRHPGVFNGWQATSAAVIAVLVAATVGLAELTYRWIETPFLARKARYDS